MAEAKKAKVNVVADYRNMNEKQIHDKLAELRAQTVEQYRAHKAGELPSASVIAKTRKDVAKALTVLREKAAAAPQVQKEEEK